MTNTDVMIFVPVKKSEDAPFSELVTPGTVIWDGLGKTEEEVDAFIALQDPGFYCKFGMPIRVIE